MNLIILMEKNRLIHYYIDEHRYERKSMDIKEAENLFKLLSDESRLTIIMSLNECDEMCACKLLERLGCGQPSLSHHMKLLVDSGLVQARKEWKWVHYSLSRNKLNELMSFFEAEKEQCKGEKR